jgi:hypothetical protein
LHQPVFEVAPEAMNCKRLDVIQDERIGGFQPITLLGGNAASERQDDRFRKNGKSPYGHR